VRRAGGGDRCGRGARVAGEDRGSGGVCRGIGPLDKHQAITNSTSISMNVLESQVSVVVEVKLSVAVVDLIKDGSDVESDVGSTVTFDVASSAVDDVSYALARVREVGMVVDNG